MRLERGIPGIFALALIIACGLPTTAHTQALGQLAVLHGNSPVVDFRLPATVTTVQTTWQVGGTAARGLALRYDDNGVLESVFVAHSGDPLYSVPASVTRIVAATGVPDGSVPMYLGATLYDLAVDRDGSVLLAMRKPTDYGCVYRLSANMATTTVVRCLPSGQTPWALALNQDGRILIGWNSAINEASINGSNGVMFLNPDTGVTEPLSAVAGSPCALLSDIAVAPGGRIYLAEYPSNQWGGPGAISWLDPATPSARNLLLSGQGMGWSIIVRPAQMAVAGTATAHTVYVADPWGICGGGGPGMPGGPCPFNGGLAAIPSSGSGASRVANWWSDGPYGVGFVGSAVTTSPVDTTTRTTPVTLAFDRISSTGSTSLVTSTDGFAPPSGFQLGDPATYYYITTELDFAGGGITVCINYTGVSYADETQLKLGHWNGSVWEELPNQTLDAAANIVCGRTMSLSPFAIFEPDVPGDTEGPALSVTVSQVTLWPANGKVVPVTLSGSAFDPSGIASLTYRLDDEYQRLSTQPQTLTLPKTLLLEARRAGNDMDGRLYTITVTATDTFGNVSQQALQVRVLHDQR